jgi:hypothetical protein
MLEEIERCLAIIRGSYLRVSKKMSLERMGSFYLGIAHQDDVHIWEISPQPKDDVILTRFLGDSVPKVLYRDHCDGCVR